MGNAYDDEFDDFDNGDGQGQNEPNWVRELRKQNRELAKQNKALSEKLGGYEKQARTTSLADLLKAKGVNPKAAKYFPTDLDVSEENLAKWLEEDGDVFAPISAPTQENQSPAEGETQEATEPAPPWMDQFQRIQRQEQAGQVIAPKSNADQLQQLQTAAANAGSSQDFLNALASGQLG